MSLRTFARAAANPVAALGVAIVLVGGTGIATAATGGNFILGRSNSATTQTFITNPNGPALGITSKAGTPPFTLGNSVKVPRLNSDYLDNLDSTQLQRRIAATCPGGAISGVSATGGVTCAALPGRINQSVAAGATALVGTIGGVNVNVNCAVVEELEGKRLFAFVYFTGPFGTLVNGHQWTSLYSDVHSWGPVGFDTPATAQTSKLPTVEAPEFSFSRQTATLMVSNGAKVSSLTLHFMVDGRDMNGKPCVVQATAV